MNKEKVEQLLNEGNTVAFISTYRKEVTGGATHAQVRCIDTALKQIETERKKKEAIMLQDASFMAELSALLSF
jgi:transcriptional accessory protein Tex/SPT6